MKQEDAEEYTQALGQVVAGGWRQVALGERLGVPKALGLSTREWVEQRLGGYVRMGLAERKEAAKELAAEGLKQREIADVLGVSQKTVDRDLSPESNDSMPARDISIEQAREVPAESNDSTPAPLDAFAALVATEDVRKTIEKVAAKDERQREKAARVAEIAQREPASLQSTGPFPVLYADPPWRYDFAEDATRQIENHYPTMALDDIKKLEVPASADAVLFLWTTSPKLPEGLDVLEAWGFGYVTCMVWVKDRIGMGYYARQQHELLLVGKRGALPVPDPEDRPPSVIQAPRDSHSAKPVEVYELIERMYPLRDKCELFQRVPRNGWAGWGNQAGGVA